MTEEQRKLAHCSLFSGIGGFDLAAEQAGWDNLFNCEIDPFCRRILKYYWPDAKQYMDIRNTDFTIWQGRIDILSGGFPCQPFSQAGKRKGTEDERHLWPEMLRAIREIKPRWVVGENVRGIISWNTGMVFEQVCSDLENQGYEVQPFLIPACGVGAPHRRERIWFVAHRITPDSEHYGSYGAKDRQSMGKGNDCESSGSNEACQPSGCTFKGTPSDTNPYGSGLQIARPEQSPAGVAGVRAGYSQGCHSFGEGFWDAFPTQPPICRGDDGFSEWLDFGAVFEGVIPSRRATAFGRWRRESLKCYGNAVVVPLVIQIYKAINLYEEKLGIFSETIEELPYSK